MIRLYRDEPQVGDVVIVQVNDISETEVQVALQGYDNIFGWIQRKQLVRNHKKTKRKPLAKLVHVGMEFPAQITDTSNGNITLSKLRLSDEEIETELDEWNREQMALKCMTDVAQQLQIDTSSVYSAFGWDLQSEYGTLMDALEFMNQEYIPDIVDEQYKNALSEAIAKLFAPDTSIVHRQVTVSSLVDVNDLKCRFKKALEGLPASIRVVAPPVYDIVADAVTCDIVSERLKSN